MTITDYLNQLAFSHHQMIFLYTWLAKKFVEMEHGVKFMSYTVIFLHT